MIIVCKNKNNRCVLVTRRNEIKTTFIGMDKALTTRVVGSMTNRVFDKEFTVAGGNILSAIQTWTESTIPMTQGVRKELKMVVAILRNKVVEKADSVDELSEKSDKAMLIQGREDLEGLKMKELVKLYNCVDKPADRVKVIPGAEGNHDIAAEKVLDRLEAYEVPVKPEKKSGGSRTVAKSYAFESMPAEGVKLPAQAREILAILDEKGGYVDRDDLLAAMEGRVKTKQKMEAILAFYQKRLIDEGYVSVQ